MSVHDVEKEYKYRSVCHLAVYILSLNVSIGQLEKFRFLGPFRYLLIIAMFYAKSAVMVSLRYKAIKKGGKTDCVVEERDGVVSPCPHCESDESNQTEKDEWTDLKRLDGKESSDINFELYTWRLPIRGIKNTRLGLDLLHNGNGSAKIVLAPGYNFLSFFKFFACWYADIGESRIMRPPLSTEAVCREAVLKLKDPFPVAIDGEVLKEDLKEMYLKTHRGVAMAFGTGTIFGHPDVATFNSVWKVRRMMAASLLVLVAVPLVIGLIGWFLYGWLF